MMTQEEREVISESLPSSGQSATAVFPFEKRQRQIEIKKAVLAELLRRQERGYDQPEGQMVSGRYVAPSIFQMLRPVVQGVTTAQGIRSERAGIDREQTEYDAADRKAAIAHALSRPQPTPEQQGPIDPNNPRELQARTPSPQDTAAWAQRGAHIPSRKAVIAKIMEDVEVNAPVRAEEQRFRAGQQTNEFNFRTGEGEKDRTFRGGESEKDRTFRGGESATERTFRSGESALDRQNRLDIIRAEVEKAERVEGAKESAKTTAAAVAKQADAVEVLELLKAAEPLIKGSTGSYVGAGIDEAFRAVGVSLPGGDKAAKLKALEGILVSKMPKMSGPQSDKDVQLYRDMAGQIGSATTPTDMKLAALETIRGLNLRYSGRAATGGATGSWGDDDISHWTPAMKAAVQRDVDKLPKGTQFRLGGKTYTKE